MTAEPFDLREHARQFGEVLANVRAATRAVDPVGSASLHCALLAVTIQDALAQGMRLYDGSGRLLTTDVEVAEALLSEGGVSILGPAGD